MIVVPKTANKIQTRARLKIARIQLAAGMMGAAEARAMDQSPQTTNQAVFITKILRNHYPRLGLKLWRQAAGGVYICLVERLGLCLAWFLPCFFHWATH